MGGGGGTRDGSQLPGLCRCRLRLTSTEGGGGTGAEVSNRSCSFQDVRLRCILDIQAWMLRRKFGYRILEFIRDVWLIQESLKTEPWQDQGGQDQEHRQEYQCYQGDVPLKWQRGTRVPLEGRLGEWLPRRERLPVVGGKMWMDQPPRSTPGKVHLKQRPADGLELSLMEDTTLCLFCSALTGPDSSPCEPRSCIAISHSFTGSHSSS